MIVDLTNENFLLECLNNCRNSIICDKEEFLDDLKRLKYLKKLITRYSTSGDIDERLVLNHLIILFNIFGAEFLSRILFLKMQTQMIYLKPFMLYLNILPDVVKGVNGKEYDTISISMDQVIIDKLRNLENSFKNKYD